MSDDAERVDELLEAAAAVVARVLAVYRPEYVEQAAAKEPESILGRVKALEAAIEKATREAALRTQVRDARSGSRLHFDFACPLTGCRHCCVCGLGSQPLLIHAGPWAAGMCPLCAKKVEAMNEHEAGGRGVTGRPGDAVGASPRGMMPAAPETIRSGEPPSAMTQPGRSSASCSPMTTGTQDSAPPTSPFEPPIDFSPEAPHRLRRAEDFQEMLIRSEITDRWLNALAKETPHAALMLALDDYRRELTLLALKRCGAKL